MAALALAFNRSTIGPGVAAGANSPNQVTTSKPGTPDSATVGTSGNTDHRCLLVTARSFTLPPLTWPSAAGPSNVYWTRPAIRSVIAGGLPRYGMWVTLMSASDANSSPARWLMLPLPYDA